MTKIDLSRPVKKLDWERSSHGPIEVGLGHLERQYQEIADEIHAAVDAVLPTGKYTLGPHLARFEKDFAAYCDAQYAIGISSGTAALHLALEALGVGPGD